MSIEIVTVDSPQDLKDFIHLPWSIYQDYPCWVPPLIKEIKEMFNAQKNPFLTHAEIKIFLAKKDGELVGRIVAIDNETYRNHYGEPIGFFGFFESMRDHEVAKRLFSAAKDWLQSRGLTTIRGPVGLAPYIEDMGLLVKGFDEAPTIMMPYNPEYYGELLEGVGFKKIKDNFTYQVTESEFSGKIENLIRWVGVLSKNDGITIRKFRMKQFDQEVARIRDIYDSIFESLWGFVPIRDSEFQHLAEQLRQIIDPDLVLMAEVDEKLVGFIIGLPDVNQVLRKLNGTLHPLALIRLMWGMRKINGMRVLVGGVTPKHRNLGTAARLLFELSEASRKKGYVKTEISWVLEDNTKMNFILEKAGLKIRKIYRLYEQTLTA